MIAQAIEMHQQGTNIRDVATTIGKSDKDEWILKMKQIIKNTEVTNG